MAQVLAKVVALIFFLSVHYIVKGLSQKKPFDMKDEEMIKFFSSPSEGATLFPN